jgi:SAM-dependent methyltransferase
VVVIRISETYGPGDGRLLKLFKAVKSKFFFMIGSGTNLHQLIFIDDLINGFLLAAQKDSAVGEVFLLVGRQPVTTNAMVRTIAAELGTGGPKFRVPLFPFLFVAVLLETLLKPLGIQPPLHRRRMDFFKKSFSFREKKAADVLGFRPEVDFARGVQLTAGWYREMGYLYQSTGHVTAAVPASVSIERIAMENKTPLTAKIEPFDTFWEAPDNIEKGYTSFAKFYRRNYLKHFTAMAQMRTLAVSCGPGYFVNLMVESGCTDILGIDSDPEKVAHARSRQLNCEVQDAFDFLKNNDQPFDLIFAEQEINHLTKDEILEFLALCRRNLNAGGYLVVHSLNGANPITGSEALAQNVDHYNTFTEYSLKQVLEYSDFKDTKVFPLKLYIFYENPVNYIGMFADALLNVIFRISFIFYGKENKLFSKKIAAIARK